jgi:glycosyltransferase involved in cell wall biosynthesis
MSRLDFSLVTTCRNEIKSFDRWKQNVLEQTRQPSEIVIVDAFSDDGTAEKLFEWASSDATVKVIQERGAAAHGRNTAIKNTNFEIILSTDMGVRLSQNWCEELITPFEVDASNEIVAGNSCYDITTIKSQVAWAEYYIEKGGFIKLGPGVEPGNRSVAYKKLVWKLLGGLPEDLTFYGDDQTFGRQMIQWNMKFAYAINAMTFWGRPNEPELFYKEMYNYGFGDGEALIKTPFAVKMYRSGNLAEKLVPVSSGLINLLKNLKFSSLLQAIKDNRFRAACWIPRLLFARGFYHSKGYLSGMKNGDRNCFNCRSRLARDEKGYPVIMR